MIPLPKTPYIHCIYTVLANPIYLTSVQNVTLQWHTTLSFSQTGDVCNHTQRYFISKLGEAHLKDWSVLAGKPFLATETYGMKRAIVRGPLSASKQWADDWKENTMNVEGWWATARNDLKCKKRRALGSCKAWSTLCPTLIFIAVAESKDLT